MGERHDVASVKKGSDLHYNHVLINKGEDMHHGVSLMAP